MAKRQVVTGKSTVNSALGALDEMEPELLHLAGLISAFQILGEAGDSIEPIAISSLARCARDNLKELERNWQTVRGALRAGGL